MPAGGGVVRAHERALATPRLFHGRYSEDDLRQSRAALLAMLEIVRGSQTAAQSRSLGAQR